MTSRRLCSGNLPNCQIRFALLRTCKQRYMIVVPGHQSGTFTRLGLQLLLLTAFRIHCDPPVMASSHHTLLLCRVFEAMKENGVRPGGKVVHSLIMGSIINGRRDLAEAYAEEFRYNGVK